MKKYLVVIVIIVVCISTLILIRDNLKLRNSINDAVNTIAINNNETK